MVDIADVVTYTSFGDHRLRGFGVTGGQISPSPIDFHRRPYNTLALPCERVIIIYSRHCMHAVHGCAGLLLPMSCGLSVCLLVTTMSCAKTAEPVEMSFDLWTRMSCRSYRQHCGNEFTI